MFFPIDLTLFIVFGWGVVIWQMSETHNYNLSLGPIEFEAPNVEDVMVVSTDWSVAAENVIISNNIVLA